MQVAANVAVFCLRLIVAAADIKGAAHSPVHDAAEPDGPYVTVAVASPGKHVYFPGLTRLRDGRLIAVFREGADHVSQDGRILATYSADGGITWNSPTLVVDTSNDERDPQVIELHDGTLVAQPRDARQEALLPR